MGLSFSCPFAEFDDFDLNIEPLVVRTISFKGDNVVKTIVRSVSFNEEDAETKILQSLGSGKMILEGSVSFKRNESESDLFNLERMISRKESPSCSYPSKAETSSSDAFCTFNGRSQTGNQPTESNLIVEAKDGAVPNAPTREIGSPKHEAALKLQKVYKSFRTRRRLADCAVLVEQDWWKLLDFAELKQSSVSFFDVEKPETAISRWSRARKRVAKVGKGLSKDEKARQLARQHWLEAIDPRHRYGHNLDFYYKNWLKRESREPFFYWLDVGEGREVNLEECPRSKLQQQCIKYLGPKEREAYEVRVEDGKFFSKDGELVDTTEGEKGTKWIFVLSTSKNLYVGKKQKGMFQHSSFLAGGAASAAGRLVVEKGILKAVWAHSGHYQPTEENFQEFMSFLKDKNVDLTGVKKSPTDDDDYSFGLRSCCVSLRCSVSENNLDPGMNDLIKGVGELEIEVGMKQGEALEAEASTIPEPKGTEPLKASEMAHGTEDSSLEHQTGDLLEDSSDVEQHLSCDLHEKEEGGEVAQESILRRINSLKRTKSHQLSFKWTTGAGPRIVCVRDYPSELQFRALEQVNLSPRSTWNSQASHSHSCKALEEVNGIQTHNDLSHHWHNVVGLRPTFVETFKMRHAKLVPSPSL